MPTTPPPNLLLHCIATLLSCVGWYFPPPSFSARKNLELGKTSSPTTREG